MIQYSYVYMQFEEVEEARLICRVFKWRHAHKINRTADVKVLGTYRKPTDNVHAVIQALMLLLGEDEDTTKVITYTVTLYQSVHLSNALQVINNHAFVFDGLYCLSLFSIPVMVGRTETLKQDWQR